MLQGPRAPGSRSATDLPALVGAISQDYEQQRSGGGSGPKDFVPPSEVSGLFSRGIEQLETRISRVSQRHNILATVARIKLRQQAVAKSHRHDVLFSRFEVVGVQSPG